MNEHEFRQRAKNFTLKIIKLAKKVVAVIIVLRKLLNQKSKIKNQKFQEGTTLIEMVVAVTIFSVITLAATMIFKTVVEGQRSAIAAQNVGESMRYALELAAKEIRPAVKSDGVCKALFNPEPTPLYKIYNKASNDEGEIIYFKNKDGECAAYYLLGERLAVTRGLDFGFLTPQKIKIKNLKFNITDDAISAFHSIHPLIIISMEAEARGKAEHKQTMKMQTSISSRYYE